MAATLTVGIVGFFAFGQTSKWVGRTDLEVRFIVTDADTGQPISNATIHIRSEAGGLCDDPPESEFTVTTDQHGEAKHFTTNCVCFGSKGRFEDTFASHLPPWWFVVIAVGYSATDPAYLSVGENARQVQRVDSYAALSIPIRLRKTTARQ